MAGRIFGRISILAAVVALILFTFPMVVSAGPSSPAPRTVVVGMAQEPDTLGRFSVMSASRVIENALFASVAPYTDRWVRSPLLVEDMPSLSNGFWRILPGGRMQLTWRIRRGFTWHDGRPVTALDFRFTYGMLRNPLTPGVSRFILGKIDHVLIPDSADPYTMVVQWNERYPFAGVLPFGEQVVFPRHVLEPAYLRDPGRLQAHPYWRAPVGNGPYRFVEWVPGSHITLEAHAPFALGPPPIHRLVFRFILDSNALQAAVLSGQLAATDINNFGIEQMVEIERLAPNVATQYTVSLRWERVNFNLDNEWLRDRRVRQAIALAIDRETIVRTLFQGKYHVAHTWLARRHPGHNGRIKRYVYDPTAARALLAEAGFVSAPDGILRDRRGQRVEMTIMSTAGHAVREQIEQILQEQLREIGIDVRIDNRPASVFLGAITRRRQFPHMALYSTLFGLESTGYEGFHSSQIPSEQNSWEGFNVTGWRNAENDRVLDRIAQELSEATRLALLKRQQEIFAQDLPALPLYFSMSLTTAHKSLRHVRPTGLFGSFLPWNAYEWSWHE